MVTKRMQRTAKRELSEEDLPRFVEEYLNEKNAAEAMTARVNEKKAALMAYVEEHGEADDKGSLFVDIEGVEGLSALKKERRVGQKLDADKAEKWLRKNGMWEKYSETIEQLDEDAFMAAGYDGSISPRTFDSFMVTSESWAFKTVK